MERSNRTQPSASELISLLSDTKVLETFKDLCVQKEIIREEHRINLLKSQIKLEENLRQSRSRSRHLIAPEVLKAHPAALKAHQETLKALQEAKAITEEGLKRSLQAKMEEALKEEDADFERYLGLMWTINGSFYL